MQKNRGLTASSKENINQFSDRRKTAKNQEIIMKKIIFALMIGFAFALLFSSCTFSASVKNPWKSEKTTQTFATR
jgi:hypothetical protein